MSDLRNQQEIAERLKMKWLQRMEALLDNGELSSTDAATLYRFFADSGWSLDPAKLPQRLAEKLTKKVAFDQEDEFGLQVVR